MNNNKTYIFYIIRINSYLINKYLYKYKLKHDYNKFI